MQIRKHDHLSPRFTRLNSGCCPRRIKCLVHLSNFGYAQLTLVLRFLASMDPESRDNFHLVHSVVESLELLHFLGGVSFENEFPIPIK